MTNYTENAWKTPCFCFSLPVRDCKRREKNFLRLFLGEIKRFVWRQFSSLSPVHRLCRQFYSSAPSSLSDEKKNTSLNVFERFHLKSFILVVFNFLLFCNILEIQDKTFNKMSALRTKNQFNGSQLSRIKNDNPF